MNHRVSFASVRRGRRGAWGLLSLFFVSLVAAVLVVTGAWGILLAVAVLWLPTLAAVRWIHRKFGGRDARLLLLLFALKPVLALLSYFVARHVYGGVVDAFSYHQIAARSADSYWASGHLMHREIPGSGAIDIATAVLYIPFGPSITLAYAVYAWIGAFGAAAFCAAFPDAPRRFRFFMFFLPSMAFWTSSISKDAPVFALLGVATYCARELIGGFRLRLAVCLGGAFACLVAIRPHMAVLLLAAMALSLVFGRQMLRKPRPWHVLLAVLAGIFAMVLAATVVRSYLKVDADLPGLAGASIERISGASDPGGSSFHNRPVLDPLGLPQAFLTVLVRPLPTEARTPLMLVSSIEGIAIGLLLVDAARHLGRTRRALSDDRLLLMSAIFVVLCVVAFSTLGNFGILVRERVQLLPYLLAVVLTARHQRARLLVVREPPALQHQDVP